MMRLQVTVYEIAGDVMMLLIPTYFSHTRMDAVEALALGTQLLLVKIGVL